MSVGLAELQKTHKVSIRWRSFELRPHGLALPDGYREAILAKRSYFYQMTEQQYGVTINEGPFGIDSRPSLVGAKYAEFNQKGPAYHEGVLRAYWQEARDISDPAELRAIAEVAGLDGEAFMAALDDAEYSAPVDHDVMMAAQVGIIGVPALLFASKYLVVGAQTYDTLVDIMRQVEEAESAG